MERSLRRDLIELLLKRNGFVSLSHLCDRLQADRKAILRQLAYFVRQEAATVTKRYPAPRRRAFGPRPQEIVWATNREKLRQLLKPKRRPGYCDRDKMWRVMRAARIFKRGDLCQLAGVTPGSVHDYLKRLKKAGHIRRRGWGTWEVVKDPGPDRPA